MKLKEKDKFMASTYIMRNVSGKWKITIQSRKDHKIIEVMKPLPGSENLFRTPDLVLITYNEILFPQEKLIEFVDKLTKKVYSERHSEKQKEKKEQDNSAQ